MPPESAAGIRNYIIKVQLNGDTFTHTEHFGPHKLLNTITLDEEKDYELFPGHVRRVLVTQVGPGDYKWFIRNNEGAQKEEFNLTYCSDGFTWVWMEHNIKINEKSVYICISNY
jgi:hypothetical protein